jgi:hypothetical protein
MLQSFILISSVCFSLAFGALARTFAYRAFRNDPALTRPCDELLFGKAYLTLVFAADDTLTGTVGDVDWQLNVTGVFTNSSLSFVGRGEVGGAPWVYNYSGILFNTLPAATMVGTVQRLLAHGPASPANESASFYAVETEPHRAITTVVGSSLVLTVIFFRCRVPERCISHYHCCLEAAHAAQLARDTGPHC